MDKFETDYSNVTAEDLNNFQVRCPGGIKRYPLDPKLVHKFVERLFTPYEEGMDASEHRYHSRVYLEATRAEFFAAIDRAIQEAGLTLQEVRENNYANNDIGEILIPVYKILREWGYTHNELVT